MKKSTIPNMFTFVNLSCGVLSILSIFNDKYQLSAIFILIAALVDRYDGRVARFLNVSSDLGKELDSLSDLVSFGVAPSLLIYSLYEFQTLGPKGYIGYLILLAFPICGAYRLARYNATDFDGVFTGIPITAAGSFMALFALITLNRGVTRTLPVIFLIILSYLMISTFKFKKV
ncbi:CDP-diacylglycerol--serine O-phosphatidyltransferase [Clostridium amylolyticum]|uniref:CDP-diacylglycerol--serine O-phosphatidyltransferase n=1 Tax=Clostridium amylolyticum TaxID=1121298 RepID=A0A1M6JEM8_9CLOT|nr:CDP-diacylglycerol--serine O-phosphatidyltransferase [Clostridium amylolyticum]SHJ45120.1 CDP-diacylglycerol--serine O-phosphatidyltransferase [Clostridium amylolyticum]